MKIIQEGMKVDTWITKIVCSGDEYSCEAMLECTAGDINIGTILFIHYYYVTCPCCGIKILVPTYLIPRVIRREIKKRPKN